jgi:hypothetical protein
MIGNRWTLKHGCHRGTLTSRDNARPEHFDTEAEAKESYLEYRAFYRSIGYQIWYADLIAPDGSEERLEYNRYW